eukprot:TRINITY_DN11014_c0_g1_i1.p1 TRINITY_DN11014_c0_g1~~TRINITY_DN11014_c0_g1_i1.p1  ORF type:complete len:265 (-),score=58.26 TRINITY_DN11014_c0_g1_i1:505-1257(-)
MSPTANGESHPSDATAPAPRRLRLVVLIAVAAAVALLIVLLGGSEAFGAGERRPLIMAAAAAALQQIFNFLPSSASAGTGAKVFAGECEGYWPDDFVCQRLGAKPQDMTSGDPPESAGCPQRHMKPEGTPRTEEFSQILRKLQSIEALANEISKAGLCNLVPGAPFVKIKSYRGLSWSRIEAGQVVGSKEFEDSRGRSVACWPDGFSEHYMERHDVIPSEGFAKYVKDFDLEAFRKAAGPCPGSSGASEL